MATGFQALTDKEKETLRLIGRGHDAKSMARHLNLSVHTVNERLRDARRKLEVSSSREAARRLLDTEGEEPKNRVDKGIGEDGGGTRADQQAVLGHDGKRPRSALIAGALMMIILAGLFAVTLDSTGPVSSPQIAGPATSATVTAESAAAQAARQFLELGDQSRWADAYAMTANSFRTANTVQGWTDAALKVRAPMGALVSRTLLSDDEIPTPPAGSHAVKFRTDYAGKPGAIETLSMVNEGGRWKVVGIYVD